MAKQTILWTVVPFGRVPDGPSAGRWRLSIVVSPRLTPQASDEQILKAFPEFLDWPHTLGQAKFGLRIGTETVGLVPLSTPDASLWKKLFGPQTPVAGFVFKDMSKVNLRSYAVRNVLGFVRKHYGKLAVQAASNHPTLLPWRSAHPDLKGMLGALGTRTQKISLGDRQIEVALPGFGRFFDDGERSIEGRLNQTVFGPGSQYHAPVLGIEAEDAGSPPQVGQTALRVLPSDWHDPALNGPDAALMSQFSSADEYTFYQANRFYHREPPSEAERKMHRPSYKGIPPPPVPPEYDFHRMIASYADYPMLLRALGLVIDCALEKNDPIDTRIAAGGGTAKSQMWLSIKWSNSHNLADDTTPRTAWQADKERFFTRPRGGDLERGLLKLLDSDDSWGLLPKEKPGLFDVYQVDPDGTALKTVGFTLSAQNLVTKSLSIRQIDGEVTYTTGDKQPVAALRSGGLGVSQHGRAAKVAQDAAAADLKNKAVEAGNGAKVVFFAEDVLRGYRVDVAAVPDAVKPGKWHTLCAREGDYRLIKTSEAVMLPADEGDVSGASTTSTATPGVNPDDHYLHESMFRWTGWSLCTPRPGLTLQAKPVPGTQLQSEEPAEVTDKAATGSGVAATFKAEKGTLPRLRFGQLYRVRARVVDLAGNSLARDDKTLGDLENASDAIGYWRFEPVDPPAMVQRARLTEGESLERMVVRSNYNATTTAYLATADFATAIALPASKDYEYTALNERHLVPPKSSQQQCEQHGLFDPFFTDPAKIKDGYAIASREAGTLYDSLAGSNVVLVTPTALDQVATTKSAPPALPGPDNPVGDRLSGGQYVIHREAQITTPYLPDGAAGGMTLRAQPGHTLPGVTAEMVLGASCAIRRTPNNELVIMVASKDNWPDSKGFRLILAERNAALTEMPCAEAFPDDGAPKWDEAARTLTLFVAKGRIVRLFYASFVHPAVIQSFGVPRWPLNHAERKLVVDMAVMGGHWMLTPFRPLTLVHATQQPICLPELVVLSANRTHGAHHADLRCRIVRLHGPSTGKFEIEADWNEWVDDLEKDGPKRVPHKGQLGEIQLTENHGNEFDLADAVNDSRIADNDNPQAITQARPRARGDRHEFGDSRFRLVHYRVRATTRFREYLPPSLYSQRDLVTRLGPVAAGARVKLPAEDDPGAPVLTDATGSDQQTLVMATAPPDDPRVLYVVPTFRWQRSTSGTSQTVTRRGNGLRVWLDRPWFSSGDGELLGVVLFRDGARFTDIPARMLPLVTQWGLDPLWDTDLPKTKISASDFSARVISEAVQLQERPDDAPVQVVGHRVHWDADRHLWYCDIELDPGATYMPFVRLALVRYQPNALPAAKISKVVLAEFAQVLPRRAAVLDQQGDNVTVKLWGSVPHFGPMKFPMDSEFVGISFIQGTHETGRNRVELVLQTRDPAINSDLAWSDAGTVSTAVLGATDGSSSGAVVNPGGIFAQSVTAAPDGRTVPLRAGGAVTLANAVELTAGSAVSDRLSDSILTIPNVIDPPIWTAAAALPNAGGKPARLVLREFERYYTDRTVPENRGGTLHRRRVIEERLVYAAVFDVVP
jgi:hypothetical protein